MAEVKVLKTRGQGNFCLQRLQCPVPLLLCTFVSLHTLVLRDIHLPWNTSFEGLEKLPLLQTLKLGDSGFMCKHTAHTLTRNMQFLTNLKAIALGYFDGSSGMSWEGLAAFTGLTALTVSSFPRRGGGLDDKLLDSLLSICPNLPCLSVLHLCHFTPSITGYLSGLKHLVVGEHDTFYHRGHVDLLGLPASSCFDSLQSIRLPQEILRSFVYVLLADGPQVEITVDGVRDLNKMPAQIPARVVSIQLRLEDFLGVVQGSFDMLKLWGTLQRLSIVSVGRVNFITGTQRANVQSAALLPQLLPDTQVDVAV